MEQRLQEYSIQERWVEMPMAEYIAGYRDFGRVRGYCLDCGRYGNCWACPPYDFNETALLESYTTISLLATKITPSEGVALIPETADRIIRRERERLDRMLLEMEKATGAATPQDNGPQAHTGRAGARHTEDLTEAKAGRAPAARAFFAGTCLLCPPEQCTRREGRPCRHPESIRPSLEALGFDIARTASDIFHIPLQWGRDGQPPEYLTLISALARKF